MRLIVRGWFLGRVDYNVALKLQQNLVKINQNSTNYCPAHTILLLEHNPVYTVGLRSNSYSKQTVTDLKHAGAEFVKTDRGGLITYHGPGQLTVYPILNLRSRMLLGNGLRWYVSALETAGHAMCKEMLPESDVNKGSTIFPDSTGSTGVWLDKHHKLMSIGIHRSGEITYHGIGLNCTNAPLEWFSKIVPCGLSYCQMTSLESVSGIRLSPSDIAPRLIEKLFVNLFRQPEHENDIEFTYADVLADIKTVSWDKIEQFILKDADFRTKKISTETTA